MVFGQHLESELISCCRFELHPKAALNSIERKYDIKVYDSMLPQG